MLSTQDTCTYLSQSVDQDNYGMVGLQCTVVVLSRLLSETQGYVDAPLSRKERKMISSFLGLIRIHFDTTSITSVLYPHY